MNAEFIHLDLLQVIVVFIRLTNSMIVSVSWYLKALVILSRIMAVDDRMHDLIGKVKFVGRYVCISRLRRSICQSQIYSGFFKKKISQSHHHGKARSQHVPELPAKT